jgi:hypothetical protein
MLIRRQPVFAVMTLLSLLAFRSGATKEVDRNQSERDSVGLLSAEPMAIDDKADELTKARIERRNVAVFGLRASAELFLSGRSGANEVVTAAERALAAQIDTPGSSKNAVLTDHLEFARFLNKVAEERYKSGVIDVSTKTITHYWFLEVKVRAEREKTAAKP